MDILLAPMTARNLVVIYCYILTTTIFLFFQKIKGIIHIIITLDLKKQT